VRQVLAIAGSDSGAGAGIQGDLKTIHACGAYALTAITAVTAQNTVAVRRVFELPAEIVTAQIEALFEDFDIAAVKTGMLASRAIVEAVAASLGSRGARNVVVDPVMVATSGTSLLEPEALLSLKERMFPLAALVTPNVDEAERLTGRAIASLADAEEAARRIRDLGPAAVLVKGGHLEAAPAADVLFDGEQIEWIVGEYLDTRHTHGSGCAYAAGIAAYLAQEYSLSEAVHAAKCHVTEAIRHALPIGHGPGPLNHCYARGGSPR
jgi:hydroxymethylpyrimidine/phosphomethylpyrimidine kinase